jgi:WD40 repeat protein
MVRYHETSQELKLKEIQSVGFIQLWDFRIGDCQGMLSMKSAQNCVSFNPRHGHLFASTDHKGRIRLQDLRRFDSENGGDQNKSLVTYRTQLYRGSRRARELDIPSAVWNADGSLLGSIMNGYNPVLYAMNDPDPLCVLLSEEMDDGHSYKSESTIKTGCFDPKSTLFCSGSDDFRVYAWSIPDIKFLESQRQILKETDLQQICKFF